MITISIDVNKIDKSRFFDGKKGRYMDLILIESPNSQFGDYIVKQGLSKQERDSGQKPDLPILGNAKIYENRGGGGGRGGGGQNRQQGYGNQRPPQQQRETPQPQGNGGGGDDW